MTRPDRGATSRRWRDLASGVVGVVLASLVVPSAQAPSTARFPVSIRVDASAATGGLPPAWRFFGADEPNYATMPHGRKLLGELGRLAPDRVYFRAHNLLTSGDGTPSLKWGSTNAYTEDASGRAVYDWTILDGIFDTYRAQGVRPYVEIGFMPEALSVGPRPYRHAWSPEAKYDEIFTGWAWPPRDYDRWRDLVEAWTRHVVERYGRAEVEQWYWQTWNEPNIGYWRGTPEEFLRLNDYAIDGVRRALPTARVGGPDTAGHGGAFTRAFLDHALSGTNFANGRMGTPLDFVSFHAKGQPTFVSGHVRLGVAAQLRTIDAGFAMVASYPALERTPIVIGESDPDGCAACQGPQLGYRNTSVYASYTAASYARILDLAARHGVVLEGALTWAFEFENQPWFAGFRALATNGVDLPVMNVFRMLAMMGGERLAASSDAAVPLDAMLADGVRGPADVAALASRDGGTVSILAWHYHDDDVAGPEAEVTIAIEGLPAGDRSPRVRAYRVDANHGNAFTAWTRMGSPDSPDPAQYAELERAGRLAEVAPPRAAVANGGRVTLSLSLPRQSVALIVLER
jgi:xylan 1,4-beta-xylosidase